jgi:hypothetical protein
MHRPLKLLTWMLSNFSHALSSQMLLSCDSEISFYIIIFVYPIYSFVMSEYQTFWRYISVLRLNSCRHDRLSKRRIGNQLIYMQSCSTWSFSKQRKWSLCECSALHIVHFPFLSGFLNFIGVSLVACIWDPRKLDPSTFQLYSHSYPEGTICKF